MPQYCTASVVRGNRQVPQGRIITYGIGSGFWSRFRRQFAWKLSVLCVRVRAALGPTAFPFLALIALTVPMVSHVKV